MYRQHFIQDVDLFIGVGIVLFACFIENLAGKVATGWHVSAVSGGSPAEIFLPNK